MKEEVIAFGEEGCTEVGWLKEELGSNRLWRVRMVRSWKEELGRSRFWRGKKEGRNKEVRS